MSQKENFFLLLLFLFQGFFFFFLNRLQWRMYQILKVKCLLSPLKSKEDFEKTFLGKQINEGL